jgi:hypothetical protein
VEEKNWISLPSALNILPADLDFPSRKFGKRFRRACQRL